MTTEEFYSYEENTRIKNNAIQVFQNDEFGEIRTIEIDGEIYFVGLDVAKSLGYSNPKKAVSVHVEKEDKRVITKSILKTFKSTQNGYLYEDIPSRGWTIINESGLYSLILASKLKSAKKFKRWVTSEVLPTIRKTGTYSMKPPQIEDKVTVYIENLNINVEKEEKHMTTEQILALLDNVKQVGNNEWCANCPSCNDTKRHLYISGNERMTVLDCKRGCSWESVVYALNLEKKDIYAKQHKEERWTLLRTHEYTSNNGNKIAIKTIYRKPDGSKTATWQRYEGNNLVKGLNGLKMPLYHSYKLHDNTKPVFIVEGEKDVETIEKMGYIATTSPNGAGSHWRKDFNPIFKDFDVIILADNDTVGLKYATEIADNLLSFAKSVKLVPTKAIYEPLKDKGDISDIMVEIGLERTSKLLQSILKTNEYLYTKKSTKNIPQKNKKKLSYFDDTGNAELFANLFGEKVRYNYVRSKWMVYQKTHWKFVNDDNYIGHLVDETLTYMENIILPTYENTEFEEDYIKHITKTRSLKGRENMLKISRHKLSVEPQAIDSNNYLFNVQNGTIDLKKCVLSPHKTENYITNVANVSFDKNAVCPLWEKVIADAMCNDKSLISYIQRVLGYCLIGSNPEECLFIFYGNTTRNGKSTILETINYLMSGYAVSVAPTTLVERNIQGANPELLAIKGARLLSCGELRADSMLNDTLLKMITGNDTISARALYGDVETFRCGAKLIANTNGLPPLRNNDMIKSGRIQIIPFNRHFEENERIKDLKDRLKEPQELSGILNWLLDGYKEYKRIGLNPPNIVNNTVNEYKHDNDKIQLFFEECLYRTDGVNTPISKIYPTYKYWMECSGYKPLGKQQFIEKMKERPEYQNMARCRNYNNKPFHHVITGHSVNINWQQ